MDKTVEGVTYVAVPEQRPNSCEGCVAKGNNELCSLLVEEAAECNRHHVIWTAPDPTRPSDIPDAGPPPGQADPNGLDQHAPGAKLDAGKDEYDMVLFSFPNALAAVDRVGKFGAKKYTEGGFLEVPNGQRRYFNAGQRHGIADRRGELNDAESGELHKAHKAWCALAELELYLQGKGKP